MFCPAFYLTSSHFAICLKYAQLKLNWYLVQRVVRAAQQQIRNNDDDDEDDDDGVAAPT